mgnify:CR=1 FL=1
MGAVWENPAAAAVPGKYRWCLNMAVQYKRILLKVSGEALSGEKGTGFDETTIASICAGIKAAYDLGAQIGIVVGGGNFWRGRSSGKMDRMDADKIGMLATVMNAIAVKDALRQQGVPAVVMTSSFMPQVAEVFTSDKAIAALYAAAAGRSAGTGSESYILCGGLSGGEGSGYRAAHRSGGPSGGEPLLRPRGSAQPDVGAGDGGSGEK